MDRDQQATNIEKSIIQIAILIYPDVVLQDFAGPLEVFSKARNLSGGKYQTFTIAQSTEVIKTENGSLSIYPDYTLEEMPQADYLLIPGGNMRIMNRFLDDKNFDRFIRGWGENKSSGVISICTGAYLLAGAGLLDGKKATTHFFVADDFSERFPLVDVVRDVRFVEDGRYVTSSGVTSGIDAALTIVERHSGEGLRASIGRGMQYTYRREEPWPVSPQGRRYSRHSK